MNTKFLSLLLALVSTTIRAATITHPSGNTDVWASGSTVTISGALGGTPTGGTLSLANVTLTLPATIITGLTEDVSPSLANDFVMTYDASATALKKVKLSNIGGGTVTSVSVVTANGVSGSVATATTTPAITLTLEDIEPTSVNGNTISVGSGTLTLNNGYIELLNASHIDMGNGASLAVATSKAFSVNNTTTLAGTDGVTVTTTASTTIPIASQAITFTGPTAPRTWTGPDANATLAALGVAQTFTAAQTFTGSYINLTPTMTAAGDTVFNLAPTNNNSSTNYFRLISNGANVNDWLPVFFAAGSGPNSALGFIYDAVNSSAVAASYGNIDFQVRDGAGPLANTARPAISFRNYTDILGTITVAGAWALPSLAVTGASTLTGGLIGGVQSLSGAGAVNVTTLSTALTTTGVLDALTLANGTAGQIKTIAHVADGGSALLTPTTASGYSTITFTNVGDAVTLQYFTTAGWIVIGQNGVVLTP